MKQGLGSLRLPLAAALLMAAAPLFADQAPPAPTAPFVISVDKISAGDTAWMLASTALVLMMTIPGLALFYAGMVRKKNVLATALQSFAITCLVTVLWVVVGYSLAFTPGSTPWVGGFSRVLLSGMIFDKVQGLISVSHVAPTIPESVLVMFQMTFAIITPALITGAFAERMKFGAMIAFMTLWSVLVYSPVAHWVWEPSGWLAAMGDQDFAGGTVVHINAGAAGIVCAFMLGKRTGYGREPFVPFNLAFTLIGASLLWVGWFGFNAGSNLEANGVTAVAFVNTMLATCAAAVSWAVVEQVVHNRPSMLGAASGAVAGLVAVTPASGYAAPMTSLVLGLIVSPICFFFVTTVKNKFKYDDTLDVFGVHCVGGITGALATAVLANPALGGQGVTDYTKFPSVVATGYSTLAQLTVQFEAVAITLVWSGVVSAILFFVIDKTLGLRPAEEAEREGLDITEHGERAYNY